MAVDPQGDGSTAGCIYSLVYRYDPQASPDGLPGNEGTFSLCSFLYVDALAESGRLDDARLTFSKMLTYANHLGLDRRRVPNRPANRSATFPRRSPISRSSPRR